MRHYPVRGAICCVQGGRPAIAARKQVGPLEIMPLQHDISHRIAIKSALEEILGRDAWYELKESTSIAPWRRNVLKTLQAIRLSISASISIRDDEWAKQVEENLAQGEASVKSSENIDELLSSFEATLLRQVFLQIGLGLNFKGREGLSLRKENWKLDKFRSVQYVQSPHQIEAKFWGEQQARIGFQRQMELHNEHRQSKSKVPYPVWCKGREA